MNIKDVVSFLEQLAPPALQEHYDNAGLITGNKEWACTGIICTLDVTEEVINEAREKNLNLVVAHHPIIFKGLKKLNGSNYVERTVIAAVKNDIAIYAIHTNLDKMVKGVSNTMAQKLGLVNHRILKPEKNLLQKLFTYVPVEHAQKVLNALFAAGAGNIGNYSECSFSVQGSGTFKGNNESNPFVGEKGLRHSEKEQKLEVIFPAYHQQKILEALQASHPYEEIAFDIISLENASKHTGLGIIGELENEMPALNFLQVIKNVFQLHVVRHTPIVNSNVKKIAVCGGSGSFLIQHALRQMADVYITADIKYHEFFDAEGKMMIADIGHWESEQFTIDLLFDQLREEFTTFAVLKSQVKTNPVNYFI